MIPSADMVLHISLGLIALALLAAAVFIVQRRFTTGQQASARTDSPNEGFFTDRAEGQGPEQLPTSRRYVRTGLAILAALFLLAALGGRFWYMPVSVRPDVLQEAHSERPTSLQPTSVQQSASPLHWRVQIRGRLSSGSDDQPAYVFTYTVSRLTGDSHTSLSSAQPGGDILLGLVVVVSACILGYMACTTLPRLLGRPCPECGSRPFRLLEENELMSEEEHLYTVSQGHYRCSTCGFNRIEVYEGSRIHHRATASSPPGYSHTDGDHQQRQPVEEEEIRENLQRLQQEMQRQWFE